MCGTAFALSASVTRSPRGAACLEREPHDPLHSEAGGDRLRHRDLIGRALVLDPPDADVEAFRILPEDLEVDRRRVRGPQRRQLRGAQPQRPAVQEQVQPHPQAEKEVARVTAVGHARIAHGAEENRVEVIPQRLEGPLRQRLSGGEIVVGAVREVREFEFAEAPGGYGPEHATRLAGDLGADPVAADDGDAQRSRRHGSAASVRSRARRPGPSPRGRRAPSARRRRCPSAPGAASPRFA